MKSTLARLFLSAALIAALLAASAVAASGADAGSGRAAIPDQYIVVLKDNVADPDAAAADLAARHGLGLSLTYARALKGFAATVPSARLAQLRGDSRVMYVVPDTELYVTPFVETNAELQAQTLPTGVDRMAADSNPFIAIDGVDTRFQDVVVAVIDTGLTASHPDLNVVGGVNFVGRQRRAWGDGNGHGTHVGGSIGALDNGIGVVGVAPGARLLALRVCNNLGICPTSAIVAAIDFVAARPGVIDVANMSLGGGGADDGDCGLTNNDPMHTAICNAVAAGVTFVVAAGNDGQDASGFVPAAYDEVITVSALADYDGAPGGGAAPTCSNRGMDDTLADFSNFGADVDLAAPGVCILSAWKNGGYNTISGTSMASPHVAGLAAVYVAAHGRDANGDGVVDGVDVAFIRSALVNDGIPQPDACGFTDTSGDGFAEPLAFANAGGVGGTGSCP